MKRFEVEISNALIAISNQEHELEEFGRDQGARIIRERTRRKGAENWQDKGGSLICRVRAPGAKGAKSFEASWLLSKPIRGRGSKWTVHYEYLRKGVGLHYTATSLLKHARPWEEEMILEIEQTLSVLRERAKKLAKARRALMDVAKTYGIDDLVKKELEKVNE